MCVLSPGPTLVSLSKVKCLIHCEMCEFRERIEFGFSSALFRVGFCLGSCTFFTYGFGSWQNMGSGSVRSCQVWVLSFLQIRHSTGVLFRTPTLFTPKSIGTLLPIARYSLFVLKVPLNTNLLTRLLQWMTWEFCMFRAGEASMGNVCVHRSTHSAGKYRVVCRAPTQILEVVAVWYPVR